MRKLTHKEAAAMFLDRPARVIHADYSSADPLTVEELEAVDAAEFADAVADATPRPARRRYFGVEFYQAPYRITVRYSDGTVMHFENGACHWSRLEFNGARFYQCQAHGYDVLQAVLKHVVIVYAFDPETANEEAAMAITDAFNRSKQAEFDREIKRRELASLRNAADLHELKFKSRTTGSIEYCAYSSSLGLFSSDYYAMNGGHRPLEHTNKRNVKAAAEACRAAGYREI